jgi:hypothetical protein
MQSLLPITIREKTIKDDPFIHSTWVTSLHSGKPHCFTPWDSFCLSQNKLIDDIDHVSKTLIACLSEDQEVILGYLTYSHINEIFIIHFGYVKNKFRKNKIMNDLLEIADNQYKNKLICITNYTKSYESLNQRYSIIYDPNVINTLKEIHV